MWRATELTMPETTLRRLLERNAVHSDGLPEGYFSDVETTQKPAVVSICCSDSRVSQEGMWNVTEPGWLFTPSTIGNQVWDRQSGERVVDGSVLYPIVFTDTSTTVVVGHTGCGAVAAALDAANCGLIDAPPGIEKWIELLLPVIHAGLEDERVSPDHEASLVDQLVEYNVDRQVAFLLQSENVPEDETIYGFVYDFQRVYGEVRGRAYLVNAGGETDPVALRERVPDSLTDHVGRLLE